MLHRTSPILASSDIRATLKWYEGVLGFDSIWTWGEPPSFGTASSGPVTVMFNLQPDLAAAVEGHQLWFDVDDVDDLYSSHLERGAAIIEPIEDKPWGRREYTVRDPSGYHLRFGGKPGHTSLNRPPFPEGVRIETRMPTTDEMDKVAGAAFGPGNISSASLAHSWKGVVAVDPDGTAIGVLRIVFDAAGWFSIWDVGVLPEWQGRRIGSAMMEAALALIRDESPGAWVYLFTYKDGFYERLGFAKERLHMRKA